MTASGDRVRYRAVIAYVGTAYRGWQAQSNVSPTVQGVLERALGETAGEAVRAVAAGRTDAGVHADGQVVHFDLSREADPEELREAVGARLPGDVRVLHIACAPAAFHARRDALWKEYLYRWSRANVVPLEDRLFVARISRAADPAVMAAAASLLPGRRDFGVFGVRRPEGDSIRTLHSVTLEERGDEVRALFRGDAFLRGMVRSICGLLADVGRGRVPLDRVREILETGDRRLLAQKAKASGLVLVRVEYPRAKLTP